MGIRNWFRGDKGSEGKAPAAGDTPNVVPPALANLEAPTTSAMGDNFEPRTAPASPEKGNTSFLDRLQAASAPVAARRGGRGVSMEPMSEVQEKLFSILRNALPDMAITLDNGVGKVIELASTMAEVKAALVKQDGKSVALEDAVKKNLESFPRVRNEVVIERHNIKGLTALSGAILNALEIKPRMSRLQSGEKPGFRL